MKKFTALLLALVLSLSLPLMASASGTKLSGSWKQQTVKLSGLQCTLSSWKLNSSVSGGSTVSVTADISLDNGCRCYSWKIIGQLASGSWIDIANQSLASGEGHASWRVTIPRGKTVCALAIMPGISGSFTYHTSNETWYLESSGSSSGSTSSSADELAGSWQSCTIGSFWTNYLKLRSALSGPRSISVDFSVDMNAGCHVYNWRMMYCDAWGNWKDLTTISVPYGDGDAYLTTARLPRGCTAYGFAIIPGVSGNFSYSWTVTFTLAD